MSTCRTLTRGSHLTTSCKHIRYQFPIVPHLSGQLLTRVVIYWYIQGRGGYTHIHWHTVCQKSLKHRHTTIHVFCTCTCLHCVWGQMNVDVWLLSYPWTSLPFSCWAVKWVGVRAVHTLVHLHLSMAVPTAYSHAPTAMLPQPWSHSHAPTAMIPQPWREAKTTEFFGAATRTTCWWTNIIHQNGNE